ncbi:Omp28-related outer membrane protein [Muricauda sp. 2012CJ35-5]|uniref:Omp28-related outer membrane protein n=1 Tax=Flagellimonas spongiicola TaxID=2942208 RepID=A0ABT0PWB3_9FLAO|nr:Omp28-related outer membrane protein [Allomuricauda spongiicola]MCL6275655.1 Omp28-related outer membrane protein [Allomuricauda spongiicola]
MKTFKIKKNALFSFLAVLTLNLTSCSKDEPSKPEPEQILGCTNPNATNYNANATQDDGTCILPVAVVQGCTNPTSNNYNANATEDNGSCVYNCTDVHADNYNSNANTDNGTCTYTGNLTGNFSNVPSEFTQHVLIEPLVGTWNGWSVDAHLRVTEFKDENMGEVIVSSIYEGSTIANTDFHTHIDEVFEVGGFPSGMINRKPSIISEDYTMGRGEWESNVTEQLTKLPDVGLALSAQITGEESLEVFIEVGFIADIEDTALHVYLIEDGLVEAQYNYYSYEYGDNFQQHPFYDQLSLIMDYVHDDVFRAALTPLEGLEIPNEVIANQRKFQRMFKINDLSSYNKENLRVIAFAAKNGETIDQKYVLNAQQININADGSVATQDYE